MSPRGSPAADISAWRATRPSAPPMSLIVMEISSVSATFILSFSVAGVSRDVASLIQAAEVDNDLDTSGENDGEINSRKKHASFIADIFAKGLFSVNVNGAPWQHIFIRVSENADEAVIIIYGLFPGRQYEIDLGLGQSSPIRSQFTTEDQDHHETLDTPPESELAPVDRTTASPSTGCRPRNSSHSSSASTSSSPSFTTESESSQTSHGDSARGASPSPSSESAPNGATFPTEEHVSELQQLLNTLIAERDALTTNLKSVRRESQKAEAALRAEIEILTRASEKHAVSEQRAKQKILALQEAHKRAVAAAQDAEKEVGEIEGILPDLVKKKEEKEKECERIEVEAAKVRKEREQIEEAEKKQVESMTTELAALDHKLEKLGGKSDKLETATIPDLEMQLRQVAEELEKIEAEERALELALASAVNGNSYHNQIPVDEMGVVLRHAARDSHPRHHSFHGTPPGGRSPVPSARSSTLQASCTSSHLQHLWNTAPSRARQQHSSKTFTYPSTNNRSQLQQPLTILSNPNRKSSILKTATVSSPQQVQHSPTSRNPSPTTTSSSSPGLGTLTAVPEQVASVSTLSSRAPVFEPGVGFVARSGQATSSAPGGGTSLRPSGVRKPIDMELYRRNRQATS
ncbi:hypothetical protein APHAL10511_002500 [Amanita phalloides]|nr:hypothetical protein APHAL10511_002500 [Amanita phalloides]